jgi:hypothetical protein
VLQQELLTIDNDVVVATTFGSGVTRRALGAAPSGIPWAVLGDRFVSHGRSGHREAAEVVTMDLTGREPRPFLTIRPFVTVRNLEPAG